MPKRKEVELFGKKSASEYLGVTPNWVEKLARQWRESDGKKGLRYWQDIPYTTDAEGNVVSQGSPYVFLREWLDDYLARRDPRKPGRPREHQT